MLKLEVIGNLGANAEIKNDNGRTFVQFRVAHTDKFTDISGVKHENTTWIQCFITGDAKGLLQYLTKGTKVFVRGDMQLRVYSSEKERKMVAGVSIAVREIELCGSLPKQEVHDENGVIYTVDTSGMITAKAF